MLARNRTLLVSALALCVLGVVAWWWARPKERTTPLEAPKVSLRESTAGLQELSSSPRRENTEAAPSGPETVRVEISDSVSKQPVPGATLRVQREAGESREIALGSAHAVELPRAGLGRAQIDVTAQGFRAARFTIDANPPDVVSLELWPVGELNVRVVSESGDPLPARIVTVEPLGLPSDVGASTRPFWPRWAEPPYPGKCDVAGRLRLTEMPLDAALLVSTSGASEKVIIDPRTKTASVELRVRTRACLGGRLVWDDGSPVDLPLDITLHAQTTPAEPDLNTTSRTLDGRFVLCDLPIGTIEWSIRYPGERSRCTTIPPDGIDLGDIRLRRTVEFSGRITGVPEGVSRAFLRMRARQEGLDTQLLGRIDESFAFSYRVLPGELEYELQLRNFGTVATGVVPCPARDVVIDVSHAMGRIEFVGLPPLFGPGVNALLRVVAAGDADGAAPQEMRIGYQKQYPTYEVHGDRIVVRGIPAATYDVWVVLPKGVIACGRHVVSAAEPTIVDVSRLARSVLRVRVVDRTDAPVAGVHVNLGHAALPAGRPIVAVTGAEGTCSFDDLPQDTYTVVAQHDARRPDRVVRVDTSQTSEVELRIDSPSRRAIQGVVTRAGKPVPDAEVSVGVLTATMAMYPISDSPSFRTKTDANGRFRFSGLFPGTYAVSVMTGAYWSDSWAWTPKRVELGPDSDASCTIDLEEDLIPLSFRSGSEVLDDRIESGYFNVPDGRGRIFRPAEGHPGWAMVAVEGPIVFRLALREVDRASRNVETQVVCVVPPGRLPRAGFVVPLAGGSIVVTCTRTSAPRPTARILRLDDLGDVEELMGTTASLSYVDTASTREFHHVPEGATVLLDGSDPTTARTERVRVGTGSASRVTIEW